VKQMVLVAVAVTLAVAVASLSSSQSASAQQSHPKAAHSRGHIPSAPDALLMRGPFVLQKGRELTRCWSYYSKDGRFLSGGCADYLFVVPRQYVPLPAGVIGRLHIRINNPQRLKWLTLDAYTRYDRETYWPTGRRRLDYTIRRVVRGDGKLAWDVSFRLPRPKSHYYLSLYTQWKIKPEVGVRFHDTLYTFHVRTF
jgi:hypothetical protein